MQVGSPPVTTEDELRRDLAQRVLLHRRRFLALLAGTGGAVVLGACSSDGSDGETGPSHVADLGRRH